MSVISRRVVERGEQYIGLEHIEPWTGRLLEPELVAIDADGLGACFRAGDVLFGKLRPYLAKAHLATSDGIGSTEFLVLRGEAVLPAFLQWCCLAPSFIEAGAAATYGAKMPRASWEDIGALLCPVPPRPVQFEIVAFLDRETAKIDALIAKQTEFLARLDEHRRALITEAVTRGLDPSVPRSIAETGLIVPSSWDVVPLKRVARSWCDGPFGSGLKSEHYADEGVRVIRLQNIGDGKFFDDNKAFVAPNYFNSLRGHDVQAGDLLIAGLGDEGHPVGRACVYPTGLGEAMVKADCFRVRLRLDAALADFVALYLSSDAARSGAALVTRGATRDRINLSGAVALPIPLPPLDEQQRILLHVRQSTKQAIELEAKAIAIMDTLRERRAALITAAVTGQIDVTQPAHTEAAA